MSRGRIFRERRFWSPNECRRAAALFATCRAAGKSQSEAEQLIAKELKLGISSVAGRRHKYGNAFEPAAADEPPRRVLHAWTPEDIARAAEILATCLANGLTNAEADREISQQTGMSVNTIANRRLNYGPSFGRDGKMPTGTSWAHVPKNVLADREARLLAADRRNFTQTFFGDPPKGYSALDQARNAAARPQRLSPLSAQVTLRRDYR